MRCAISVNAWPKERPRAWRVTLHLLLVAVLVRIASAQGPGVELGDWVAHPDLSVAGKSDEPWFDEDADSPVVRLAAVTAAEAVSRPSNGFDDSEFAAGSDADPILQSAVGDFDEMASSSSLQPFPSWIDAVNVGYDRGFVVASEATPGINPSAYPFLLRLNGLGQLRHTRFESRSARPDLNQFQLMRGRLIFSGNAFTPDLRYFIQIDSRSSRGDEIRLLDYFLEFDLGHFWLDARRNALVFKTGRYKVPFTFARFMSAREFQFSDRSVASMFFDLNRSLAWGLGGQVACWDTPMEWEVGLFNGFITGGAETGSVGALDNNFAYSARFFAFPLGDWGTGTLSDFDWHDTLATRVGAGYAGTTIDRSSATEFNVIRVVDSGGRLSDLLPETIVEYSVDTFCVDASAKYRGWSITSEYYFRTIHGYSGDDLPGLFDHGFWLQVGKFVVPQKLELLSRWSRVVGTSGTLGQDEQSADEVAGGLIWYFRGQNAKIVADATWLNGAPINSSALDITPGAIGWLIRTQIQFAF